VEHLPQFQIPTTPIVHTLMGGSDPKSVLQQQLLAQLITYSKMTHVAIIRMMERELVVADLECSNDAICGDCAKI